MLSTFDQSILDEIDQELAEEKENRWKIDNPDSANWALKKMNALNKKMEETNQLAKNEMERINKWQHKENEADLASYNFFNEQLSAYLRELRNSDPKAIISSPYGRVSTRKVPAKISYNTNAVEELKQLGLTDYIRVK